MAYSTVIFEKADGIATLTLNRPERFNAFNDQMLAEMYDVFRQVEADKDVRVFVITGAGKFFSSGADVKDIFASVIGEMKSGGKGYDVNANANACMPLRNLPQPTIASINGTCVGLGMTLALQCDIRLAADDAKMSFPFVRIGMTPEFGSTYSLPRLVGMAKACELVFTARTITANEAKEMGLVNQVVPLAELKKTTEEIARAISDGAPLCVQAAKKLFRQGIETDFEVQLRNEGVALVAASKTEDHVEAVKAFLEKRQPVFKGK